MKFTIKKILIDEMVKESDLAGRILKNSSVPYEVINVSELKDCSISEGKQTILVTSHKGDLVKQCPGTGEPYICCRYFVINQLTQCPIDCTYCILQNYLSSAFLTVYTDIDLIYREIESLLEKQPKRLFRIGTGELTDSLALDYLSEVTTDFMKFLNSKKNTLIEFKSKTDNIENIIKYPVNNTVISWSLNPQELVTKYEAKSASLQKRFIAARTCQDKGFLLGFHFDPILYVNGWEELYKEVIDQLFSYVDSKRIVWISLGSLRYPPDLKRIIKKRFPEHQIIYEEMIAGVDGKMRYPRPLRIEMYKMIYSYLKSKDADLFIYFCMEPGNVWKRVMGRSPESNAELDYWFAESINSRFLEVQMDTPQKDDYSQYPDERLTYKDKR